MINTKTSHIIWVVILFISLFCGPSYGETNPVGFSIPFPNLTFQQALSREEQAYLGIPRKTAFSSKEIRGSLMIMKNSLLTKANGITTSSIRETASLKRDARALRLSAKME